MALVLAGKSASGKDTIARKLCEEYGFSRIVTYTTRAKRDSEEDGVSYHFISHDDFVEMAKNGFFAEWQQYKIADGSFVLYGCALEDIKNADKNSVVILTPKGIKDLTECGITNLFVEYIYANEKTMKSRLIQRGDNPNEILRRIESDRVDFKDFLHGCNKVVYNFAEHQIADVVKKVTDLYMDSEIWKN